MTDEAGRLTVVLSSHLVTDLERVCDHLILLAGSRVQLAGDIDTLLAEHRVALQGRERRPRRAGAVRTWGPTGAADRLTTIGEES